MKKILTILLVITAIPLYTYDLFLLLQNVFPSMGKDKTYKTEEHISYDKLLVSAAPVKFEVKGRSPFVPQKIVPKPVVKAVPKQTAAPAKEPPKPPSIVITGIMWDPSNPVAMLTLPDGSSTVAKAGQSFGAITIKKIEKNRIQIISDGTQFWINR